MAILTREKLASYGIEVLVVVFGILIAFQVEEWREDRRRDLDLDAVMVRLTEESAANLEVCERVFPRFTKHAHSALDLVRVLNEGRLSGADIGAFEAGLIRVGYIQGAPYSVTVAEEMIATGLLKELDNASLRNRIAELPVWVESTRGWLDDTRGSLRMAVAEVAKAVEFHFQGPMPDFETSEPEGPEFEDGIGVSYDFDQLVANSTLKNVLIEAADTHLDMWIHQRELCRRFSEIQSSLAEL